MKANYSRIRAAGAHGQHQGGFTLIEFLVAIVLLMVGMLGLLQSITVALHTNLENILRTEAVMLADDEMMRVRAKAFNAISTTTLGFYPQRNIRGVLKNYSVRETVSAVTVTDSGSPRSKQIDIEVIWKIKNKRSTHSVSSIISTFPQ